MPNKPSTNLQGALSTGSLKVTLSSGGNINGGLNIPKTATIVENNYENLINKPRINGVELVGNMSTQDLGIVSENTTAGWNDNPQYLPKAGEICVYTDHITVQDDQGHDVVFPGIKIGDGNSFLIDLPFADDGTRYLVLQRLSQHEQNMAIHVSPEDRVFWNNKLNYDVAEEELILNRL